MLRLTSARGGLQHAWLVGRWGLGCVGLFGADRHGEQLARLGDVGGAVAVGEQPVVADAMEALRQHVHQEPADELVRRQLHRFPAARTFDTIVLPAVRHASIISSDEPAIRDGDAMSVAREIAQHLLWPGERLFAVDDPLDSAQRCQKLKVRLSASPAWVLKNVNRPPECASISIARNLPRNRRASTLTCTRKSGL